MNYLLRPRMWPSFLASSGVGPCDVPFRYASEPIPRYRGTSCQVASPSSSRSLRSAQSRTASGICDKRVPSFLISRQQFMKYPGSLKLYFLHYLLRRYQAWLCLSF